MASGRQGALRKEAAMGADLYIDALYAPRQEQWRPEFDKAVQARDHASDEASRNAAQLRVEQAYAEMHGAGYFRDPYNDRYVLWKFGLSWWKDVIRMLGGEGPPTPGQAG